jgi:hypothetical protein
MSVPTAPLSRWRSRCHREERSDEAISTGRALRGPRLLRCARNDLTTVARPFDKTLTRTGTRSPRFPFRTQDA